MPVTRPAIESRARHLVLAAACLTGSVGQIVMHVVAVSALVLLFTGVSPMLAAIGDSVEELRRAYGSEVEVDTYRPDLYPTSYDFRHEGAEISAELLHDRASKLDVFFQEVPADDVVLLLERFSGVRDWRAVPSSGPRFERHFPLFDPKRCAFFVTEEVVALVQRDVGFGKLVLWIQSEPYPALLEEYRKSQKGRANKRLDQTRLDAADISGSPPWA